MYNWYLIVMYLEKQGSSSNNWKVNMKCDYMWNIKKLIDIHLNHKITLIVAIVSSKYWKLGAVVNSV